MEITEDVEQKNETENENENENNKRSITNKKRSDSGQNDNDNDNDDYLVNFNNEVSQFSKNELDNFFTFIVLN